MAILRAIPGGGLVLVDGYKAKISKGEALDAVMNYWIVYPTLQKIGVESIGKGEEFYNDLVMMTDVNGRMPPLFEIKSKPPKGECYEYYLGPRFQFSRVWVSDTPTPWLNDFENNWLLWPNVEHDDDLDSVYMAARAAEGFMPSKADRTHKRAKQRNPYLSLGSPR